MVVDGGKLLWYWMEWEWWWIVGNKSFVVGM